MTESAPVAPPAAVIEQYALDERSIAPLSGGLINLSFIAQRRDGAACVLQRVNPIFSETIHDDIDAVTRHLEQKGLTTPRLLETADGRNRLRVGSELWRLMTRIEGHTHPAVPDDGAAREAGRVLGAFHAALADFTAPLASRRLGVHDTTRHMSTLRETLDNLPAHPDHADVAALAERIFAIAALIDGADEPPARALPDRLVHGDPKISNVVFRDGRAVCLIDLDTLTRMPAPLELGDALRSWCNLAGEDRAEARLSTARFEAALTGYAEGAPDLLTETEWRAIPKATLTIAVELAARFAADALNESYFGWDAARFTSASEHNLIRAAGQLELAEHIHGALRDLESALPAC